MTISNDGNKAIKIQSDNINSMVANPADYLQINIAVKRNCCNTTYLDTVLSTLDKKWYVDILKPTEDRYSSPKTIYLKNIDNGEVFKIDLDAYPIVIDDCGDLNEITTLLNYYFNSNFPAESDMSTIDASETSDTSDSGSYTVNREVIGTCDSVSKLDYFVYGISYLPDNIIPLSLDYEYDGVPLLQSFYSAFSEKNSMLNNEDLTLSPEIINSTKFNDAIYTITLTFIKNSGTQIIETQCFFLDCKTRCNTIELAAGLNDKDRTEVLMLHYGLTIGSNCACSCSELCDMFRQLSKWLEYTEENCNCGT